MLGASTPGHERPARAAVVLGWFERRALVHLRGGSAHDTVRPGLRTAGLAAPWTFGACGQLVLANEARESSAGEDWR